MAPSRYSVAALIRKMIEKTSTRSRKRQSKSSIKADNHQQTNELADFADNYHAASTATPVTTPQRRPRTRLDDSEESEEFSNVISLSFRTSRTNNEVQLDHLDSLAGFRGLPRLPRDWNQCHDRAICRLDIHGYPAGAIVAYLRRRFPELNGALTPAMIERRFRILDQIVQIDYWRAAESERLVAEQSRGLTAEHMSR